MKRLILGSFLSFLLFNGDCWGMNIRQDSVETSSDSGPSRKRRRVAVNQIEDKNSSDSVVDFYTDSDDSSFSQEWIADHAELIQKACYEEGAFMELIGKITEYSDSAKDRETLYNEIEDTWDRRNMFGAMILDNGRFFVCDAEHCD